MTDLEMTKKCAEVAGIDVAERDGVLVYGPFDNDCIACGGSEFLPYDPLNNDAQAMALAKKFEIDMIRAAEGYRWLASCWVGDQDIVGAESTDLNRAIVQCVAAIA